MFVVQSPSCVRLFATPWTASHQASLSLTVSQSFPKFIFIAWVMLSSHLILCCSLLLLLSIFPSIKVFSNVSAVCIRWPKYWASAAVLPMSIQSWFPLGLIGLISLLSRWLSKKSLLQHHSSKASGLQCSTFFMVQGVPGSSPEKGSTCMQETPAWSLGQEDPLEKG